MSTDGAQERLFLQYGLDRGVAVVRVGGDVDVATCGVLRDGLLRMVGDECYRGVVVNLAGVNFIDSTGIGVLVGVWHRARARGGSMAVAVPSRQVQGILDTTGLAKVFPIFDSETEAVQACCQPAGT
jgi:anti-sigma B factor antagonist